MDAGCSTRSNRTRESCANPTASAAGLPSWQVMSSTEGSEARSGVCGRGQRRILWTQWSPALQSETGTPREAVREASAPPSLGGSAPGGAEGQEGGPTWTWGPGRAAPRGGGGPRSLGEPRGADADAGSRRGSAAGASLSVRWRGREMAVVGGVHVGLGGRSFLGSLGGRSRDQPLKNRRNAECSPKCTPQDTSSIPAPVERVPG